MDPVVRGALDEPEWLSHVRLERAYEVERELLDRWNGSELAITVGVTDLLDLRRAYYRRVAPVSLGAARQRVQGAGREAHQRIGALLGRAEFREVRVRDGPIVGEIDYLDDHPTEVKSTGELPALSSVLTWRPAYFEQLGMYCALVDRLEGRLVIASTEGSEPRVLVLDCTFGPLEPIRTEMRSRADQLIAALKAGRPDPLPRCAWRGRGCEFQGAGVCACTGEEGEAGASIRDAVLGVESRPEEASRLARALGEARARPPTSATRFRDLLYPRRAYFERTEPSPEEPEAAESTSAVRRPGELYRTLRDLLDALPSGAVTRRWPTAGEPGEPTTCLRGQPLLLKTTRSWREHPADRLAIAQPQYALELGLRAAAIDTTLGLLVVGYERAERREDRLRVYRATFEEPDALAALFERRRSDLARAVADHDPSTLPSCPGWMVDDCPYRGRCGCGAPGGGT